MTKNIIKKFRELKDIIKGSDRVNLVLRDQNGEIKAIRDVSDDHEFAIDFNKDKFLERHKKKNFGVKFSKEDSEIHAVNRFLSVFNQKKSKHFEIIKKPLSDSHIDVLIGCSLNNEQIGLQVRVSDDEAWKESHTKDFFERSGLGFDTYHDAIRNAIVKKLKYPLELRKELILLLDGWPAVRPEDLKYFRTKEKKFMRETGYEEIWFVGGLPETIVRLFP